MGGDGGMLLDKWPSGMADSSELHITLFFYGEVDEPAARPVI